MHQMWFRVARKPLRCGAATLRGTSFFANESGSDGVNKSVFASDTSSLTAVVNPLALARVKSLANPRDAAFIGILPPDNPRVFA